MLLTLAADTTVRRGGLWWCACPSGVGVGGVVDWVPMEDYRFIMEVRPP